MKKSGEYIQIIRDIENEVSECVVSMVSLLDNNIDCENFDADIDFYYKHSGENDSRQLNTLELKGNILFVNDEIEFCYLTLDSKISIYNYLINLDFIKLKV